MIVFYGACWSTGIIIGAMLFGVPVRVALFAIFHLLLFSTAAHLTYFARLP